MKTFNAVIHRKRGLKIKGDDDGNRSDEEVDDREYCNN